MRNAFLLFVAPLLALAQTVSFLPPRNLVHGGAGVVGDCPACVAVADFNGDGKPDIAYNLLTPLPQGAVLLGNGDGTFRPALNLPYPTTGPLLTGDFNGDGKIDLLGNSYETSLYLGRGDGTFLSPTDVSQCTSTSSLPAVVVGDFNRDGKSDIICAATLLLSNGDGTFTAAGNIGPDPMQSVVLTADFNNDGIADVLVREPSGNFSVFLCLGNGTFSKDLPTPFGPGPGSQQAGFLAGDFNHDGRIDLVTFSWRQETIYFAAGKGDGTFGPIVQTDISMNSPPAITTAGDFNKDGNLDFVAGDAVYAGNGDGTFRFPVFFGPASLPCGAAIDNPFALCGTVHSSTAIGDFNNDGLPDLVTYSVDAFNFGQIKETGEFDMLINDSPGNGFGATGVSAATATSPVGSGSIVSAYGINLAPNTELAATNPAPTTLGGIRLHIRDRSHAGDSLAPLLYVSPTQINYVLTSSDLYAFVDIERIGSPYTPQGMTVPIAPIAPGFFAGPYTVNAPAYLSLYGTGFAQASASASSCHIGDVNVPITYAGPELVIAGLDQVNLLLPASLSGAGVQPVNCTFVTAQQAQGITNTINVTIR